MQVLKLFNQVIGRCTIEVFLSFFFERRLFLNNLAHSRTLAQIIYWFLHVAVNPVGNTLQNFFQKKYEKALTRF